MDKEIKELMDHGETEHTVNTRRQCAAYPPGLWVNSKAECRRRREGRDGAAKERR